jgi:hypothetical protein
LKYIPKGKAVNVIPVGKSYFVRKDKMLIGKNVESKNVENKNEGVGGDL